MIKQFVVGLPSKVQDSAGALKSKIMNTIAEKYPFLSWHGIDCEECPLNSVNYAGPEDYLTFGINKDAHFAALNKRFFKPTYCNKCTYNSIPLELDPNYAGVPKFYNAATQLDEAMYRLHEYAKFVKSEQENKGFDFKYLGQPVKIYPNFIQIGYTIIPFDNYRMHFNSFENSQRQNIVNIIIKISNTETINNIYA